MRRKKASGIVRLFSRLTVTVFGLVMFSLVSVQFARIVNENLAMAHTLASVQRDVAVLRERNHREQREIRRLLDPDGAIPAIHDRLHLVQPDEAIIYLKNAPTPAP